MEHAATERRILQIEKRWAWFVGALVLLILAAILFAGLSMQINPPSNREFVDPKTLHLSGEFTEANLGTRVDPNGHHEYLAAPMRMFRDGRRQNDV